MTLDEENKPKKRGRPPKNRTDQTQTKQNKNIQAINKLETEGKKILQKLSQSTASSEELQKLDSLPKWNEFLSDEIDSLNKNILEADKEFNRISKKLKKIEQEKNRIEKERSKIKKLISRDQDQIYESEQRMLRLESNQYSPNVPDILRPLIQFITGQDDEILLRIKISKSETKLYQRQSRLVETAESLSDVLINETIYLELGNSLKNINEVYRNVRMKVGRFRRDIIERIKTQQNKDAENSILENYVEIMKKMEAAGSEVNKAVARLREGGFQSTITISDLFKSNSEIQKLPEQIEED